MRGLYLDSTFAPGATAIASPGNAALEQQYGQKIIGTTGGSTALDAQKAANAGGSSGIDNQKKNALQGMGADMLLQGIQGVGSGIAAGQIAKGMAKQRPVLTTPEGYSPALANFVPVMLQGRN